MPGLPRVFHCGRTGLQGPPCACDRGAVRSCPSRWRQSNSHNRAGIVRRCNAVGLWVSSRRCSECEVREPGGIQGNKFSVDDDGVAVELTGQRVGNLEGTVR